MIMKFSSKKLVFAFITGCICLFSNAYAEKIANDNQNSTYEKKQFFTVGNVNGTPIRFPSGSSNGLSQYDDTPGPFSLDWKDYKRPAKRTYQDNLMSFGFEFKYPENELFNIATTSFAQYGRDKGLSPDPWIHAIVYAGKSSPRVPFETFFERTISLNDPMPYPAKHLNTGKSIFGLEVYEYDREMYYKKVKRDAYTAYENEKQILVHRDEAGKVVGFIECSKRKVPNPPCTHHLRWKMFNNSDGTISYSRQHLEHWQEIQQIAEDYLRSWIVEPEIVLQSGSEL